MCIRDRCWQGAAVFRRGILRVHDPWAWISFERLRFRRATDKYSRGCLPDVEDDVQFLLRGTHGCFRSVFSFARHAIGKVEFTLPELGSGFYLPFNHWDDGPARCKK